MAGRPAETRSAVRREPIGHKTMSINHFARGRKQLSRRPAGAHLNLMNSPPAGGGRRGARGPRLSSGPGRRSPGRRDNKCAQGQVAHLRRASRRPECGAHLEGVAAIEVTFRAAPKSRPAGRHFAQHANGTRTLAAKGAPGRPAGGPNFHSRASYATTRFADRSSGRARGCARPATTGPPHADWPRARPAN